MVSRNHFVYPFLLSFATEISLRVGNSIKMQTLGRVPIECSKERIPR
jgi:hypothetical protein